MSDPENADQINVHLDTSKCHAYGICVGLVPEVFDLPKGSSVAVLLKDIAEEEDLEDLDEAVHGCPTNAISLTRPGDGQ